MSADPLELPPQHIGVELSELTLVAACALPEGAALWPVRAVQASLAKAVPVLMCIQLLQRGRPHGPFPS